MRWTWWAVLLDHWMDGFACRRLGRRSICLQHGSSAFAADGCFVRECRRRLPDKKARPIKRCSQFGTDQERPAYGKCL
jgi:hypothetical protein